LFEIDNRSALVVFFPESCLDNVVLWSYDVVYEYLWILLLSRIIIVVLSFKVMDFLPCPYLTQLALSHRVILLILSVQYNFLVNMIFL